jgi:hypothetical protein
MGCVIRIGEKEMQTGSPLFTWRANREMYGPNALSTLGSALEVKFINIPCVRSK